MYNFEHYKKQFNKAVEKVVVDKDARETKLSDHLATLFGIKETKFNRTVAMLSIMCLALPADIRRGYKTENLPINPESYEFKEGQVGAGGENYVYLLESKDVNLPSLVMKINHLDNGDIEKLAVRAGEIKKEYEEVASWYKEMPGFVPQEHSVIMENPRNGKPAIITMQQYYGNKVRDIFKLAREKDFAEMLKENPRLADDIFNFVRITEEKEEETGDMVDLLGHRNVSVIKIKNENRLILLDPHLVSEPHRSEASRKREQRFSLNDLKKAAGYEKLEEGREAA